MIQIKEYINKCFNDLDVLLPEEVDQDPKILMIDDEQKNLTSFRARFRRDAKVFTASNRKEALSIIKNNDIDVVFCDYKMPIVNGADILKEIVDICPNIKRSIVTAYTDSYIKKEFKEKTNTFDIILKPYNYDDIISRIFGLKQVAS